MSVLDAAKRVVAELDKPGGEWHGLKEAIGDLSDAIDKGEAAPATSIEKDALLAAFPQPDVYHNTGQVEYGEPGMTLRDYFAAKALNGYLAGRENPTREMTEGDMHHVNVAKACYRYADAMLVARRGLV